MAGTLPGVGVGSRRMRHHHRHDDPLVLREPPCLREFLFLQHSTTGTMPEAALIARQRLDRKLAHFRASSRSSSGGNRSRESSQKAKPRDTSSIRSKILRKSWKQQLNSGSKSDGEMCNVCLEDFGGEQQQQQQQQQQVMELSCSHKYHSKCLVPWLASHPHCPTCRSPVQCASLVSLPMPPA